MEGELTQFGRKGPSWRRIITVVPPLHLYHVFCNRSFSIFPFNCDGCGGNIGCELNHFTANDPN